MRASLLAIFIACCISSPTNACDNRSHAEWREDVRQQVSLATDAAKAADTIFVARAVSVDSADTALFQVTRRIKGSIPDQVSFVLHDVVLAGCTRSAEFSNTIVEPGELHIIYVKDGSLIRVSSRRRDVDEIGFRKELRVLRKVLGPNNSFKPKPLRGSA